MPMAVLQIRADAELLQKVKGAAARHGVSASQFVIKAVKASLAREKEQEWREGFEAMGRDPDTNDVEYLLPAAREVLDGG